MTLLAHLSPSLKFGIWNLADSIRKSSKERRGETDVFSGSAMLSH